MKSIVVKMEGGGAMLFNSGTWHERHEDGTSTPIELSEEDQLQECYEGLMNHVKRKEFERNLKNLVLGYLDYKPEEVENIQIVVKGMDDSMRCELNVGVTIKWETMQELDLPTTDQ